MSNENAVYLSEIVIRDYKNFRGRNEFDLSDGHNQIMQWTVILGNNSTGKTNLLRAIADLESTLSLIRINNEDNFEYIPINVEREFFGDANSRLDENCLIGSEIVCKKKESNDINPFKNLLNLFVEKTGTPNWMYLPFSQYTSSNKKALEDLKIYGYGTTRRTGKKGLSENDNFSNSQTLFSSEKTLINIEDWLLQLDYASKNNQKAAERNIAKIRDLVYSGLFPEISNFRFVTSNELKNYIEFETVDGWYRLTELGYGYQSTISWMIDFCKKMFDRYPNSTNPLAEPAVLLVDEIDLHLHPSWQKNIIQYLSKNFPATQFIVTTHSPFIVQSIEKLNLFVLTKKNEGISVAKVDKKTLNGWSLTEILENLMNMKDDVKSKKLKTLYTLFDKALDGNDYKLALSVFNDLDDILHPYSSERKILKLQLSQLTKND